MVEHIDRDGFDVVRCHKVAPVHIRARTRSGDHHQEGSGARTQSESGVFSREFDDLISVGEGMSLALITTLYGSILANWICIPLARRLEKSSAQEVLNMELCIEVVLSIQAGENPRIIQEKLASVIELQKEEAA